MQSLNPFLRAFFTSKFAAQCSPASQYILFVPTTEYLLLHRDKESESSYSDLAPTEDFLGSHVIRAQTGASTVPLAKDTYNFRESKGISKQFSTANGKTVVIKDNFVYCHRGFKTLSKAQLLHDAIYYPDIPNAPQWLLYYISRPLIGDPQSLLEYQEREQEKARADASDSPSTSSPRQFLGLAGTSKRADIASFRDIIIQYPAIARQIQTPLDRLCQQFRVDLDKYHPVADPSVPATPTSSITAASAFSSASTAINGDSASHFSNGTLEPPFSDEEWTRRCLETLVLSALDEFQRIDKQQLSALGSSTDLSGPAVERMIERHVTEIVYEPLLFPRLAGIHEFEDLQLGHNLDQMTDIDVHQVGLTIEGGQNEKRDVNNRVNYAVDAFNKMESCRSPQDMIDVLLETERKLTSAVTTSGIAGVNGANTQDSEKQAAANFMNADMLVSMLLLVLIRSPVRQLTTRLHCMRDFVFVRDVESGETGYSLSTFEAVLAYLSQDSVTLKKASRANRTIRHAIRKGNVELLQKMLDPEGLIQLHAEMDSETESAIATPGVKETFDPRETSFYPGRRSNSINDSSPTETTNDKGDLSHVFPFQRSSSARRSPERPLIKKRVSMDTRSMSSSSLRSSRSRSSTLRSGISLGVDTTPQQLVRIQDSDGNSILMKSIIYSQPRVLRCLLEADQLFPSQFVLDDCDYEGTTLFAAAIQYHEPETIALLADYLMEHCNAASASTYLRKQDAQGRTAAHYFFNTPNLISTFGNVIPWRTRDKNGCTPLYALCRSYDHDNYVQMLNVALQEAVKAQGDGEPLHLDDHVDSKGNTLLHIVNDVKLIKRLLNTCDSDPNAANEKKFTPLMMASKFARVESIRAIFHDQRTDIQARDFRGLTAVELAKDEEVRTRIDELVLLSTSAHSDGRMTTIARSLFVEDGTIRMIVKSGAPTSSTNVRVTTCRRSLADFENLARWLTMEEPASWVPMPFALRNPFQLSSKPSRLLLRDTQLKLNGFLESLVSHPTFSSHETLWEFLLVPDIDPKHLAERALMKSELRVEKLREDFDCLAPEQLPEVELFTAYATEQVVSVFNACSSVLERINALHNITVDLLDSHSLFSVYFSHATKEILPPKLIASYDRYRRTLVETEASPLSRMFHTIQTVATSASAVSSALARPSELMSSIDSASDNFAKQSAAAARLLSPSSIRWPSPSRTLSAFGGLLPSTEGQQRTQASRQQQRHQQAQERVRRAATELEDLGRELAATRQTVAVELAAWQSTHAQTISHAIRDFARRSLVVEKTRFERMKAALREMRAECL